MDGMQHSAVAYQVKELVQMVHMQLESEEMLKLFHLEKILNS